MNDPAHQLLREMLGAYALGQLDDDEQLRVRQHLDGCTGCRAELAEIEPLRALLATVDPDVFALPPAPPPGLGQAIRASVAAQRQQEEADELARRREERRRRRTTRIRVGAGAAALVVVSAGVGLGVGRATAPEVPVVPTEVIALELVRGSSLDIDDAVLIDHTWGVELRFVGSGFPEGETFRASFLDDAGVWVPAGEFRGIGAAEMTCNLQSATLREDVTRVRVTDAAGRPVMVADL